MQYVDNGLDPDYERKVEAADAESKRLREERLLDPQLSAWLTLTKLPAYAEMSASSRSLQKAVFDYAWEAAMRAKS